MCHPENLPRNSDQEEDPQYRLYAEVASSLFNAPMARISMVDHGCVRVVASHGEGASHQRTIPRHLSFDARPLRSKDGLLVINDTAIDPVFRSMSEVTGASHVRFYAGVTLTCPRDGRRLGTVCVMDDKPRPRGLCAEEIMILQEVAREVALHMQKERNIGRVERRASAPLTSESKTTHILRFLRLLEIVAGGFYKRVNVYLSTVEPIPAHVSFNEAEAFGSAVAVLKSACERTLVGYIQLRLSLRCENGKEHLVFECEDTGPDFVEKRGSCLPVIESYMRSAGGSCGIERRVAPSNGTGSVVWFSLPVLPFEQPLA